MSATVSLVLDRTHVHIVRADAPTKVHTIAWSPDEPEPMVNAAREHLGTRASFVVVVGLGLLEIAEPDLPPLAHAERRALLLRDADRYFPLDEPVAVNSVDRFAFAISSRCLQACVRALGRVGTVNAIVTAPQVAASLLAAKGGTQSAAIPADNGERGVIQVRGNVLVSARRSLALPTDTASSGTPTAIDTASIGRAALGWNRAPIHVQLLDNTLARLLNGARQRRWAVSALAFAASLALLLWASDTRRERTLAALEDHARTLAKTAAPAEQAEARASRAAVELSLLQAALSARQSPDGALAVLAQLTRVLPRDAFVQRLEWDGTVWRVDGTADNAPRLVPLMDADTHFRDVRIAASSQRFLDLGRQRETFSISFRARAADSSRTKSSGAAAATNGGVNGAP